MSKLDLDAHARGVRDARRLYAQAWADATGTGIDEVEFTAERLRAELTRLREENKRLEEGLAHSLDEQLADAEDAAFLLREENERLRAEAVQVDFIRGWHTELMPRWLEQYTELKQRARDAELDLTRMRAVVEAARRVRDSETVAEACEGAVRLFDALAVLDAGGGS